MASAAARSDVMIAAVSCRTAQHSEELSTRVNQELMSPGYTVLNTSTDYKAAVIFLPFSSFSCFAGLFSFLGSLQVIESNKRDKEGLKVDILNF